MSVTANVESYPLVLKLATRHIESAHAALAAMAKTASEKGCSALLARAQACLTDASLLVNALAQ